MKKIFICSWPSLDYSVAKHIVNMWMRIFSVLVSAAVKNLRHQKEMITYEAVCINYYYECMCLYSRLANIQSECAMLYCCPWPVGFYYIFTHYLTNDKNLEENIIEHKMCVLILSTILSEIFLIPRRLQRDIVINVRRFSSKVPIFLSECNETWIFSTEFRKIFEYKFSLNSVYCEQSCSMRADGRTEMRNPIQ